MIIRTLILLLTSWSLLQADGNYWVFFTDKPEVDNESWYDSPPNPDYLETLRDAGYELRRSSRWLNAVSLSLSTSADLEQLRLLPFVSHLKPVARSNARKPTAFELHRDASSFTTGSYGQSYDQLNMLDIPQIHSQGFDGSGIRIAILDQGFVLDHPTLSGVDILETWDFVDNESDPDGSGDDHGLQTLSILAGYLEGEFIGAAYGASYLLARTEDQLREVPSEEDNWVAALEWADSIGVDIVSSSLNYREFDDPQHNYSAAEMDGKTAVVTMASNVAAQRGILIVNAIGNEGPAALSLWPPADSPHVLAVGAVSSSGSVPSFSGRGPTADGRIKPDVVALGSGVYAADEGVNPFTYVLGTSFATPIVAGAAALLLQYKPCLSPDSVITLLRQAGNSSAEPDNIQGYGIPSLASLMADAEPCHSQRVRPYPNPYRSGTLNFYIPGGGTRIREDVVLYSIDGRQIWSGTGERMGNRQLSVQIPPKVLRYDQLVIVAIGQSHAAKFIYLK